MTNLKNEIMYGTLYIQIKFIEVINSKLTL